MRADGILDGIITFKRVRDLIYFRHRANKIYCWINNAKEQNRAK